MTAPAARSFTIATSGRPETGARRWWLVRIHDTLDQLRAAASRYDTAPDFSQAYAVCHTAGWITLSGATRFGANGYAGIIRFAATHLTGEVVVHELLHAACAVYRMVHAEDVRLGRGVSDREEQLAYILGELFATFEQHFTREATLP